MFKLFKSMSIKRHDDARILEEQLEVVAGQEAPLKDG
jgi:hypothetical protein